MATSSQAVWARFRLEYYLGYQLARRGIRFGTYSSELRGTKVAFFVAHGGRSKDCVYDEAA